ncbi:MAG: hypothetical protein J0M15_02025 [Deltaproteobacteria bacterium]|jgi:hypothetical protein|nr:hypothetical protein [Deltaproteobacteria bacterium]
MKGGQIVKSEKTEALWLAIVDIIRLSPAQASALELESLAYLLLTILDYEISPDSLVVIYHSAVEGENLEWLIDRLEHKKPKAS